jgi:hypothetical protein
MCNFCEPYKHEDESTCVDLLCDFPELNYMACIKGETPISKRREAESKRTSSISIHTPLDDFDIPIRYCPICGKDLYTK